MAFREQFKRMRAAFASRAGVSLWLPLIIVVLFFAFHELDPFGIGHASAVRSEQATLRIVSPFYAPSGKVAVILIDDAYLRAHEIGWPLAYAAQGQLLRQILAVNPAAIVIDLVYPHRHGAGPNSGDEVSQLVSRIEPDSTTPIIFTAMAKEPDALPHDFRFCKASARIDLIDPESMLPTLLARLRPAAGDAAGALAPPHANWLLSYIRWSGCGTRYPLMLGGDPNSATPAFAAFRAYCAKHSDIVSCSSASPATEPEKFQEPMTIRWGAFPPSEQSFAYGTNTCQAPADRDGQVSAWRKLKVAVTQLTLGIFQESRTHPNHEIGLPCPAITVIPLGALEQGSVDDWRELLSNKIVLLGANISGIPDIVDSPVHGQVPGVVLHGMALDNLLTLGPRYLADRQAQLRQVVAIVLAALFAYALPFMLWLLDHARVRRVLAATSFLLWITLSVTCLLLGETKLALAALGFGICFDVITPPVTAVYFYAVLFAALISVFQLNRGWPPGNWLGLLLLVLAFSHTVKPFYHESARAQLPHRYSVMVMLYNWVLAKSKGI